MWRRLLSDRTLERDYLSAGDAVGDALSMLSMCGAPVEMPRLVKRFAALEREYARRGNQPLDIESFRKGRFDFAEALAAYRRGAATTGFKRGRPLATAEPQVLYGPALVRDFARKQED